MARQIIKQPNGLYAIWSTIIDDFVYENITIKEYIKILIKETKKRTKINIAEIVAQLDNGEKPYYQFTMTYKEALDYKKEVHNGK